MVEANTSLSEHVPSLTLRGGKKKEPSVFNKEKLGACKPYGAYNYVLNGRVRFELN